MLRYKQYLEEATAKGTIGHSGHLADGSLNGIKASHNVIGTLRSIANNDGETEVTKKFDGSQSLVASQYQKPHKRGKKLSTSFEYKGNSGLPVRHEDDAEDQYGPKSSSPKPHMQKALGSLAANREGVRQILPQQPGSHQFDVAFKDGGGFRGNMFKYHPTPNADVSPKAKILIAPHTSVSPGKPSSPISPETKFGKDPKGAVAHFDVRLHPEEKQIAEPFKTKALKHLSDAEEELKKHTDKHLFGSDGKLHGFLTDGSGSSHIETYINNTLTTNKAFSSEDLAAHISAKHQKNAQKYREKAKEHAKNGKVKFAAAATASAETHEGLAAAAVKHIRKNKSHFDRMFRIHNHLQSAVNTLNSGFGDAIKRSGKSPWVARVDHPEHGELESNTGEGFHVKGKGVEGKIVGRSTGGLSVHPSENFAWLNRNANARFR